MIYFILILLTAWVIFMSLAVWHLIDRVNGLSKRTDAISRLASKNRRF